jgi:hypothetical protein
VLLCGIAFFYTLGVVICSLIPGASLGINSGLICILLWLSGIMELSMGILGEYMTHIYREAKDRPVYLIRQTNISDAHVKN